MAETAATGEKAAMVVTAVQVDPAGTVEQGMEWEALGVAVMVVQAVTALMEGTAAMVAMVVTAVTAAAAETGETSTSFFILCSTTAQCRYCWAAVRGAPAEVAAPPVSTVSADWLGPVAWVELVEWVPQTAAADFQAATGRSPAWMETMAS